MTAALAEITWGAVMERLIGHVVVGVIIAAATIAVLKWQLRDVVKRVEALEDRDRDRSDQLAAAAVDRSADKLEAAHAYATRGEVLRATVAASSAAREISVHFEAFEKRQGDKLDQVHGRVTALAGKVENLSGQIQGLRNGTTQRNRPTA